MKFIHLSDLHIGRRLGETSLLADQVHMLQQILSIVRRERPQAVLIAGDVYDKTVPSAEAVAVLDDFLTALSREGIPTLLISGNHDSAERLSFAARLLEESGIHISPVYDGRLKRVTLTDGAGPVDFWLLPFLKPAQVRRFFPEETIESYTDACRAALAHAPIDPDRRNILLAHQFVTGASTCESEELSVGGLDNVDATVFEPFCYTALGHIHGPQNIGSSRIRYCGTPLKYSFSEAGHHKSLTLGELDGEGRLTLRLEPLVPLHDLRQLRGTFAQVTDPAFDRGSREDYLHIQLTDEEDIPEAMAKLRLLYPNLLKLTYDNTRTRRDQTVDAAQDVRRRSPLDLFEELYSLQNNQPLNDRQRAFLLPLMESIWEDGL